MIGLSSADHTWKEDKNFDENLRSMVENRVVVLDLQQICYFWLQLPILLAAKIAVSSKNLIRSDDIRWCDTGQVTQW